MYNNGREHNPPHFHAYYGDKAAIFNLDGDMTEGDFASKEKTLVKAWALIHQDELKANWELCVKRDELYRIAPLR